MGSFSQALTASILNNYFKASETPVAKPAKIYLSLLTVVPTAASTGASVTEAVAATGYAKKEIAAAAMHAAVEGSTSSIENELEEIFAAIIAGEATVIAWCLTDKAGAKEGNMLAWGTATSTVISSTQTPPTIKAGGLKLELK